MREYSLGKLLQEAHAILVAVQEKLQNEPAENNNNNVDTALSEVDQAVESIDANLLNALIAYESTLENPEITDRSIVGTIDQLEQQSKHNPS